jgi:hypothetical protein
VRACESSAGRFIRGSVVVRRYGGRAHTRALRAPASPFLFARYFVRLNPSAGRAPPARRAAACAGAGAGAARREQEPLFFAPRALTASSRCVAGRQRQRGALHFSELRQHGVDVLKRLIHVITLLRSAECKERTHSTRVRACLSCGRAQPRRCAACTGAPCRRSAPPCRSRR